MTIVDRTRMDYPGGFYVTYGYNTASDLTSILENGSSTLATYVYDDLGRRTSLTRGNGVVTSYTFDSMSRLNTLVQNPGGSSHDTTFTFAYNPSSQITSRTRTNGAFDWVLPSSFSDSYTANGLNQYTNVDGVMPTYDARGNLTYDGSKTYGYDYDNRMTSASGGVSLNYDPAGRLHEFAAASATRFLYDGTNLIAEYSTTGSVLRRYVHGPGVDEPLVWYEGSGTANKSYLLADERGSVIGVTNTSGNVTGVNRYDAYGVPGPSNVGRFQYTAQAWLEDANLYHYRSRTYSPALGRFLQVDPIGTLGGANLYEYVGGDPVGSRDPLGLCSDEIRWVEFTRWNPSTTTLTGQLETFCRDLFESLWGSNGSNEQYSDAGGHAIYDSKGQPNYPVDTCGKALQAVDKDHNAVRRARDAWPILANAGSANGIGPVVLASIGVRESGFRNVTEIGGGRGVGVFQLTPGPGITSAQAGDLAFSAGYAAQLLSDNRRLLARRLTNFTDSQLLHATIASYNIGPGSDDITGNPNTIDVGTAGDNYGRSVLDLRSCFLYP